MWESLPRVAMVIICPPILWLSFEHRFHYQVLCYCRECDENGNIVPSVGIRTTSLAFEASVLQLHHIGSLMSPVCSRLPVCAAPCLRGQCRILELCRINVQFTNVAK